MPTAVKQSESKQESKSPAAPLSKQVPLAQIRIDGGTQSRIRIDDDVVSEYAAAMKAGGKFPPVHIFCDGAEYWLSDGFHRYYAAKQAGLKTLYAVVREGTKRDAMLHSFGANDTHGLRRTNEDKRNVVQSMLYDVEWATWSDHEIARRCAVSRTLVVQVRESLTSINASEERTYTTKQGTVTTMKTGNIGHQNGTTPSPKPAVETVEKAVDNPPAARPTRPGKTTTLAERVASAEVLHDTLPASNGTAPAPDGADLTDDEWLQTIPAYRVIARKQGKGIIARRSMLDYRTIEKVTKTYQHHTARCESVKHPDGTPISTVLMGIDGLRHPREWGICPPCKGGGCQRCGSAGYDMAGGISAERIERGEVE